MNREEVKMKYNNALKRQKKFKEKVVENQEKELLDLYLIDITRDTEDKLKRRRGKEVKGKS